MNNYHRTVYIYSRFLHYWSPYLTAYGKRSVAFVTISAPSALLWSHHVYEISDASVPQWDQCSFTGPDCIKPSSMQGYVSNSASWMEPVPGFRWHHMTQTCRGQCWQQGDLASLSWSVCCRRFGAARPRVNTGLCLCSQLLPARGKKIPEAGAQCLARTFLAKDAGSESVFDLVLLQAK